MKHRHIILIFVFSLVITSCFTSQKYPIEWPELASIEKDKVCDISGTYSDFGSDAQQKQVRLSALLFGETYLPRIDSIQIIQSTDKIEISAWREASFVYSETYTEQNKEFHGTKRGVEIPYGTRAFAEALAMGWEWRRLYFVKSTDGSLIIKAKVKSFGFLFLVPLYGTSSSWYRFEQKNKILMKEKSKPLIGAGIEH